RWDQQVVCHEAGPPRDVPTGGRVADLWLRAPAVGGGDAERQATVESRRVDLHTTENVQVAQGPLAFGDPRRVVAVPGIDQQGAADDTCPGAHVKTVGVARDEAYRNGLTVIADT